MTSTVAASESLQDSIERLVPVIHDRADEIEQLGRLPEELAAELKAVGLFRSLLPTTLGGAELDLPSFLRILDRLGQADGSVAWCASQGTVINTTTAWLPEASARRIWSDPNACVANGPPNHSRVTHDGDGYRLNGRWSFSSGNAHATWLSCVARDEDGKVGIYFIEREHAQFLDNWDTRGLVGTGSQDFEAHDTYVAADCKLDWTRCLSDAPFYKIPTGLVFAVCFASVALGIARGALEFSKDLAGRKSPRFLDSELRAQPHTHARVGKAEILLRAGQKFLFGTVEDVWDGVCNRGAIVEEERVSLRMAGSHCIRQAAEIVDIAYDIAGTDAIHPDREIQRRFQDMHVITQHMQGRTSVYEHIGRYLLGLGTKGVPIF